MDPLRAKYLALACFAGVTLAQGALAQKTASSTAFCRVESISRGSAVSQDAYTEAWLDIGNYVCGSQADTPTIINIDKQVRGVASAIAEAFAEVSTNCFAQGNAEVRAQAYAMAQDRATAIGEAVTGIYANAEVCDRCTATIDAVSTTTKELLAEAVAEAWTELYIFSDSGTRVEDITTVTSHVIEERVAEVLSGITGTIRAGAEDGCSIGVINEAQVGDYFARCELEVSADQRVVEIDAIAKAGAEAKAYACNGDIAEAEVDVIAKATATALAEAVAQADQFCESNGGEGTMACGLAESNVRAVASAQADAFANAIAAAETCDCNVEVHAEAHVWDEIWVEAVANAYAEACVFGTDSTFESDFQFAVEERMLTATARAIASAVAATEEDGDTCRASISVCGANSSECVRNNGKCGGDGFDDVLPCCDPDYRCFVRNERDFRCRHRNYKPPSFWDGRIEECTLGL